MQAIKQLSRTFVKFRNDSYFQVRCEEIVRNIISQSRSSSVAMTKQGIIAIEDF